LSAFVKGSERFSSNRALLYSESLRHLLWSLFVFTSAAFVESVAAQESTLVLKNGMIIGPGLRGQTAKVNQNAFAANQNDIAARPIVYIDDGLRITFVNQNLIQTNADRAVPLQRIETGNVGLRASGDHLRVQGVKGAVAVTPFDPFGRRVYSLMTPRGRIDVLQGITELSAAFVRVDGLNADKAYVWDMRLALSAVPADRLREILINHADPADPQSWLNIVALYSDARRYVEAREMLSESIRRFPELENQRPKLKQFEQLHAKQMLDEVRLRMKAGQPKLAESLLRGFPLDDLAIETRLEVERRLSEIVELQNKVTSTKDFIQRDAAAHNRPEDKPQIDLVLAEILGKLSVNNLSRFSDYLRLRDDPALTSDQRVAMFIANWLMGSGVSETNLPVMLSAWDARELVAQYLRTDSAPERESLLDRLKSMEGGSPRWVAKMLSNLSPPRTLPQTSSEIPGRFTVDVPNAFDSSKRPIRYSIQLPPEYDPERRYPCVVTLHGQIVGPDDQLQWWSGAYSQDFKMCVGEASRHGYIIVAPHWAKPKQPQYDYTEDEHAHVLRSLRDAMRRTSIDSDRVYLSGHHMGGDAVWDMALAHPDLWAGMIAIGADCEKFATQYSSNARYIPLYFVVGSIDGAPSPLARKPTGEQLDDFLKSSRFDCLLTVYQGRGRDHFQDELPRIVEWMNLSSHVRPPPPDKLEIVTSRSSDRSFWWLEVPELAGDNIVNPLLFKPGRANIEGNRMSAPENGFRVSSYPGKNCILWLGPEFIDFEKKATFFVKGKKKNLDLQADLSTLLEDVRTRADRQHPYWAKLDF
jgi:pimeloyl-ACP methyl ester carboxylesterase